MQVFGRKVLREAEREKESFGGARVTLVWELGRGESSEVEVAVSVGIEERLTFWTPSTSVGNYRLL